MNLLEKWKNRETKKKLREENIRLKTEIEVLRETPKPPVCTVERKYSKGCGGKNFSFEEYVPAENIKGMLISDLSKYLSGFVDFDFCNNRHGDTVYTAELYVATGE